MRWLAGALVFLAAWPAFGAGGAGHHDPIAQVVLWLAIILVAAKLGGELAVRLGQPAVLGELLLGVLLGNLGLTGFTGLEPLEADPTIDMLARLGVLLLLFEVGLESTVGQMLKIGWSALLVALLGVALPFALGWGVGIWLLPGHSEYVHAFLGATLTATSVGITARVLKDLGRSQTSEARVILGAAVIDDVLGLVILAVVVGVISAADRGGSLSAGDVALTLGKAGGFLIGALVLGVLFSRKLFSLASRLRARGVLLALGLVFCFLLAWLASVIGLAPIVGAFAAGLILEEAHYRDYVDRGEHGLEELIHPISSFLVPVFFVLMGMRTDLRSFAQPGVLGLAGALTAAAILGKQACSLGVLGRGVDRLTVGLGMIPRGEVGLIFANIGLALTVGGERVIDEATFSAVVVMVIVTTMLTPPALKWSLGRRRAP
ncbi:MAG TPA: cation:proton antiporter [Myxococcota bacterium]|nr:cation:proton antiporter [Myxococcota bacterium]HRY92487.1 cation:proton antiporter [Myxococcota bacterium]HSA22631.1 cation:proton antiporter [Myxococcota bacterium]